MPEINQASSNKYILSINIFIYVKILIHILMIIYGSTPNWIEERGIGDLIAIDIYLV